MSALDRAEAWLAAHAWDAGVRRWRPRGEVAAIARHVGVVPTCATPSTPAELFARAHGAAMIAELEELVAGGLHPDVAADRIWRAMAADGCTAGEIAACLRARVDAGTLRTLAARHAHLQVWGPDAPPAQPRPGARRLLEGRVWTGETWAPSTEGELWPTPHTWEWLRLRRASPGQITKVFVRGEGGAWTVDRQAPPVWYVPELVAVADDVEAWAELLQEWEHDDEALLVRGILARNPDERGRMRRTLRGDEAWIAPHPIGRRALVFDVDKIDPAAVGCADWPGAVRWPRIDEAERLLRLTIQAKLPACFHQAAAAYRWSASAGVPRAPSATGWARPSAHVVFVVDRPVHDESLELWLEGKADPSVAGSEHALYLAPPRFEGEVAPRWPEDFPRVGLLDGRAEVETPAELIDGEEWELLCEVAAARLRLEEVRQAEAARRARPAPTARTPGRPMTPLERAKAWLACREPAIEGHGGDRHTYITCAAMVHDFGLSEADALEALRAWNATCRPPWSDAGLRLKLAAALAYGTGAKGNKIEGGQHAR